MNAMKSVELKAFGRPHTVTVPDDPPQTVFGLRRVLRRYRGWYAAQVAANRHRIEEEARRFHGTVTWEDKA